jgi:IMP dehydrogenase/GMP reductase
MLESYKRRLLAGGGMTVIPRGMDPEKAAKEGAEWKSEVERKAVSVGYKPAMTAEDIQARELHMRYIQENYNARTGRPLQTWIPENEWLEKQKQGDL